MPASGSTTRPANQSIRKEGAIIPRLGGAGPLEELAKFVFLQVRAATRISARPQPQHSSATVLVQFGALARNSYFCKFLPLACQVSVLSSRQRRQALAHACGSDPHSEPRPSRSGRCPQVFA